MRQSLVAMVVVCLTSIAQADVFNMPSGQTSVHSQPVSDAGNAANADTYGAVGYNYRIGTYDVTNAQYVEFLNAKAAVSDPFGLYSSGMTSDAAMGGIIRSGTGPYSYAVKSGFANKPVDYVSWRDTLRFSNWLTNGQGSGITESGTYTITGGGFNSGTVTPPDAAQRAAWATGTTPHWMLPSENEWYKAAYYKGGGTNSGYWTYPFKSNSAPTSEAPPGGSNSANFKGSNGYVTTHSNTYDPQQTYITDVGSYSTAQSPYGAFDMGGDLFQWNEVLISADTAPVRGARGGSWADNSNALANTGRYDFIGSESLEDGSHGFRVAGVGITVVPEPGSFALLAIGGAGLLLWARRRKASR